MLGLTLECARCHDHRFDPITQRDYYALFAFFNNIDESGLYSHFTTATPSPSLLLWPAGKERGTPAPDGEDARARGADPRDVARGAERRSTAQPKRAIEPPAPIVASGLRSRRRRQDAGQRVAARGGVAGWRRFIPTGPGALRFSGDNSVVHPGAPTFEPHRSVLAGAAPAADRTAGPRRRPASVPRLDRRRQPRLRADARSRPAVLRR